mgnify:CR=1 FL=1|jgi:P27 family predicted phage terminase small subunit
MSAPVPIERKRALGNPGKRALPSLIETLAIEALSSAPLNLAGVGLDAWNQISSNSPWLSESDLTLLSLYCEKVERHAEMLDKLKATDFVFFTEKGYAYSNPLVGMLATIETDMVKILSLMGLTPADRSRLGLAEVKAASTLEKLRAAKANK